MPSPAQQHSTTGSRRDPFTVFCFKLEIHAEGIKKGQAFFKSISGLKSESEVVPYHEGGLNTSTHQLIGPVKWPNLILKQGFTGAPFTLLLWRERWLTDDRGGKFPARVNGKIVQLSSEHKAMCHWSFTNGWPCSWEGPEYDADKNELAIETLEIAHEGLVFGKGGGE